MKKISLTVLAAMLVAGSVQAFDIPTGGSSTAATVKHNTKEVTKAVTTAAINDKIKKENCAFVKGKKDQTTCDMDKILKYLTDWKTGLKTSGITSDFDIHVEANADKDTLAWDRVRYVEKKLKAKVSYWDWYSHKGENGDKLKIWITQN